MWAEYKDLRLFAIMYAWYFPKDQPNHSALWAAIHDVQYKHDWEHMIV